MLRSVNYPAIEHLCLVQAILSRDTLGCMIHCILIAFKNNDFVKISLR